MTYFVISTNNIISSCNLYSHSLSSDLCNRKSILTLTKPFPILISKHKKMRYYLIYCIRDNKNHPDGPFPWFPRCLMAFPHQFRHPFCCCSFISCKWPKLVQIIVHFCHAAQQTLTDTNWCWSNAVHTLYPRFANVGYRFVLSGLVCIKPVCWHVYCPAYMFDI